MLLTALLGQSSLVVAGATTLMNQHPPTTPTISTGWVNSADAVQRVGGAPSAATWYDTPQGGMMTGRQTREAARRGKFGVKSGRKVFEIERLASCFTRSTPLPGG